MSHRSGVPSGEMVGESACGDEELRVLAHAEQNRERKQRPVAFVLDAEFKAGKDDTSITNSNKRNFKSLH